MAETKPEEEAEPEMVELNSQLFFDILEKLFKQVTKDLGTVDAIAHSVNNWWVFGQFDSYANIYYSHGSSPVYEVLRVSYGVFTDYPDEYRRQYGEPLGGMAGESFRYLLKHVVRYHAAANGFPYYEDDDPKNIENWIHGDITEFFRLLGEKNPDHKGYVSEENKQGIVNFIGDYDKFCEKYYADLAKDRDTKKAEAIAAKEREAAKKKEYERKVKAGELPIKNLSDAILYYGAKDGTPIITNPPLKADGKYYHVSGKLEKVDETTYFAFYHVMFDMGYFAFEMTKNASSMNPDFRIGKKVVIVGKFVDIGTYVTVVGSEKYATVFKAEFVETE
jgi:hypothetical protein